MIPNEIFGLAPKAICIRQKKIELPPSKETEVFYLTLSDCMNVEGLFSLKITLQIEKMI